VTLAVRTLNQELTCPVCLGIMQETKVVIQCMHRFCGECIEKCLRQGKAECPSCRVHVGSRRSLATDPNFDDLIRKIYPRLEEYEELEEKRIADLNATHNMHNAFTQSSKHGMALQLQQRKKTRFSSGSSSSSSHKRARAATTASYGSGGGGSAGHAPSTGSGRSGKRLVKRRRTEEDMTFVLRRHPNAPKEVKALAKEYISTSKFITIKYIKEFLHKKLLAVRAEKLMIQTHDGEEMVRRRAFFFAHRAACACACSLPPPPSCSVPLYQADDRNIEDILDRPRSNAPRQPLYNNKGDANAVLVLYYRV
jgi:E3 ubiquitin-protein ligase RNF1/2